jgi:hypothetical protein
LLFEGAICLNFPQVAKVIRGLLHGLKSPLVGFQKECHWGGLDESQDKAAKWQ